MDTANNFELSYALGKKALAVENHALAIDYFVEALATGKASSSLLLDLGLAYFKSGKLGCSIACNIQARELFPKLAEPYKNLAGLNQLLLAARNQTLMNLRNDRLNTSHRQRERPDPLVVLVLCAGESSRWNNYLGVRHKHLINVEGEVLLSRTVRQIRAHTQADIRVLVPDGCEALYAEQLPADVSVSTIQSVEPGQLTPAWKYRSSEPWWNRQGSTVCLLGDVWFSDDAIARIFTFDEAGWFCFGRPGPSRWTGCAYGEIFALRFDQAERHGEALTDLENLYRARLCREAAAGWALMQLINNENPNIRTPGSQFVVIDDFTEDFDFPRDYVRWVESRGRQR